MIVSPGHFYILLLFEMISVSSHIYFPFPYLSHPYIKMIILITIAVFYESDNKYYDNGYNYYDYNFYDYDFYDYNYYDCNYYNFNYDDYDNDSNDNDSIYIKVTSIHAACFLCQARLQSN